MYIYIDIGGYICHYIKFILQYIYFAFSLPNFFLFK